MTYDRNGKLETKNDYNKYIGKRFINGDGDEFDVLGVHDKIESNKRYIVRFVNRVSMQLCYRASIIDKSTRDLDRYIGQQFKTNKSGIFRITGWYFTDGTTSRVRIRVTGVFLDTNNVGDFEILNLKRGECIDTMTKTVKNVGFHGNTKREYDAKEYSIWTDMIERVTHSDKYANFKYYEDVTIDENWYNFALFLEDISEIIGYSDFIANGHIDIDKDILSKLNGLGKIYSKESCLFIPHELNTVLNFSQVSNTSGYPGVSYMPKSNNYQVGLGKHSKRVAIGNYKTAEDGFKAYRKAKIEHLDFLLDGKYSYVDDKIKESITKVLVILLDEAEEKGRSQNVLIAHALTL